MFGASLEEPHEREPAVERLVAVLAGLHRAHDPPAGIALELHEEAHAGSVNDAAAHGIGDLPDSRSVGGVGVRRAVLGEADRELGPRAHVELGEDP